MDEQTEPGTAVSVINQQLQTWKKEGAHVLAPMTLQAVPALHRPVVVAVYIDPDSRQKEVYPQRGGGLSISSLGWKKLADGMGVQWLACECGRLDDGKDPEYVHYRMVGLIKALDGTWSRIIGDKEIRLSVLGEEMADNYAQKALEYASDPKDGPAFRQLCPTADHVRRWVAEKTRVDLLQIRKHLLSRAQSGAMSRAIKMKGIRETYTAEELRKPFVFPKLVFAADPNNPQDRAFLLGQASGASQQIFGARMAAPAEEARLTVPGSVPSRSQDVPIYVEEELQAPTEDEMTKADFDASEPKGQAEMLDALVIRKGYDRKSIRGLPALWSAQDRLSFFARLMAMPDVESPKGSALPFD